MAPPNKILIVVTGDPPADVAATRGDYATILRQAIGDGWTGDYAAIDVRREPPSGEAAALIITGSSSGVYERADWMLRTEAWLRDVVAGGTPVLGVCFGHQLLAQALGGEVQVNPRGREMGTIEVERTGAAEADPLLAGLERRFRVNACHTDTVLRLPPDAEVLAQSQGDPHQVLRFGPACYGVQFHPELDGELMRGFVRARRDVLLDEGLDPHALERRAADTPSGPRILQSFVRRLVRPEHDPSLLDPSRP